MIEGAKFAQENGKATYTSCVTLNSLDCLFLECSAFSGENIEEVFGRLTKQIVSKLDSGEVPLDQVLNSRSFGSTAGAT
jgi:hypothetical protein